MSSLPHVRMCGTPAEFHRFAAEEICRILRDAIRERGVCFVALSGGETPRRVYQHLGSKDLRGTVAWENVQFFFGDERAVPPTDPRSNFGMVERELFRQIRVPAQNIHRIKGEEEPGFAAAEYDRELRRAFGASAIRFDLALLGVGEDGHTAGLFPGTSALDEGEDLVRGLHVPRLNTWRITMTLGCFNGAREILFLATGAQKASIVCRVLHASGGNKDLPATLIHPTEGNLRWLLDPDAGKEIREVDSQEGP